MDVVGLSLATIGTHVAKNGITAYVVTAGSVTSGTREAYSGSVFAPGGLSRDRLV